MMQNKYLYSFMISNIKTKYNKKISVFILTTYTALLLVTSFHFHGFSIENRAVLSEKKEMTSRFPGDVDDSNGTVCHFLLNYKSNVDFPAIAASDFHIVFAEESILFSENNYHNHAHISQISFRAPPSAPYISL